MIDDQGDFWRAITFIEGPRLSQINDASHAEEAGFALGMFQRQISDLVAVLYDTLPGFHHPHYLGLYDIGVREPARDTNTSEIRYGMAFVPNGVIGLLSFRTPVPGRLRERRYGTPRSTTL